MKHVKTFEDINKKPKVGDYVLCNEFTAFDEFRIFLNNNIGKIVEINSNSDDNCPFCIEFKNIPKVFTYKFPYNKRNFSEKEIVYCSDNIEELETFLSAKKYNL